MQTYYLAHSCQLIKSVRSWQLEVEKKYRVSLVNPFNNNELEDGRVLRGLTTEEKLIEYMGKMTIKQCKGIVEKDLELLRKCDAIIAIFHDPSIGTVQEIFSAWYLYRIPVYIITDKYSKHPWLRTIVSLSNGGIYTNFKQLEKEVFN